MKLSAEARAALAASLLESLDEGVDEDVEAAWAAEIATRVQELDSGAVAPVPWAEARRMIQGAECHKTRRYLLRRCPFFVVFREAPALGYRVPAMQPEWDAPLLRFPDGDGHGPCRLPERHVPPGRESLTRGDQSADAPPGGRGGPSQDPRVRADGLPPGGAVDERELRRSS